jgi:hypothetical protein
MDTDETVEEAEEITDTEANDLEYITARLITHDKG